MRRGWVQRLAIVLAFLAVVLALSAAVWRYGFNQGLEQLAARGDADLALAGDRLVGQLQRYRDLAVTLADHPGVVAALRDAPPEQSRALLQEVADKSATLDVLVLDVNGRVRAAAQEGTSRDLRGQPLVQRALRGALGWGHGPALPLTERAFYHAAPMFGPQGRVRGAVVVITDLNGIDYNWRGTNPPAFFTDARGVVYISNRSEILLWQRPEGEPGLRPPAGPEPAFDVARLGGHEIWTVGWGPYLPREALHLTQDLPVIGMTGEVLLDVTQARALARAQAAAVAALCLAFGSLLFLAAERRRALAEANTQLEARVAERTAALRRAQDDLVQAGKLSALGQMSAGISHELNQPLMAIRSFAENAVQFMERGTPERATENLTRISDMARRMGRIIQNLRAFARQETGPQERVELGAVLRTALELTQTRIDEAGVSLQFDPADHPIWVRGGEVRLSQVFVNLITNALDAMADSDTRHLCVMVSDGDTLTVNFRDTGPGIEVPDKVFDPFYTTKQVGETGGMGLGLSISYGIVQSFGGNIRGANADGGGAIFTVTLERAADAVGEAA
ncbi:sensor histidine kinase [Sulfitobacter sp. JB4-11]|uniref:sensor histidine kinase n=1 Tax=Sulfitobacter rhodophyticola TaxID=3238304 RepID=UPI0035121961